MDQENAKVEHIPCLFLANDSGSASKLIVYFHGAGEDIGDSCDHLSDIGEYMRMHCLAVEYPGYGIYRTSKASEEKIKEDALTVYDYLT